MGDRWESAYCLIDLYLGPLSARNDDKGWWVVGERAPEATGSILSSPFIHEHVRLCAAGVDNRSTMETRSRVPCLQAYCGSISFPSPKRAQQEEGRRVVKKATREAFHKGSSIIAHPRRGRERRPNYWTHDGVTRFYFHFKAPCSGRA